MRIYNRYIITVAVLLLLTTVILVAFGIDSVEIYYISYIMETLLVTELYRYLSPQARRALTRVSIVLLGIFLLIVVLQVIRILGP